MKFHAFGVASPSRSSGARWVSAIIFLFVVLVAPATAQIARSSYVNTIGGPSQLGGYAIKGSDIAYDPTHDVYLVIHGFFGPVIGIFIDRFSEPVSPFFTIGSAPSNFPRARYSPDLNGGQGGFMVAWAVEGPGGNHEVHTRGVAYPGTLLGVENVISDPSSPPWLESGTALAYSPLSRLFLVSWATYPIPNNPGTRLAARFIDLNGAGLGTVGRLSSGYGAYPSVAWNSATNEFGVSFGTEDASGTTSFTALSVVSPFDQSFAAPRRQTFNQAVGYGFITDLDYNPDTNRYVIGWHQQPAGVGPEMRVAEIDASLNVVSTGLVSSLLWGINSLSVSFHPISRTFLFSSLDHNDATAAFELNSRGFPVSSRTVLASGVVTRYNRSTPATGRPEWGMVFSDFYRTLKGFPTSTAASGGGAPGAFGAVSNPTPTPTPTPSPTPDPGSCTSPSPGVGWICSNGNWLPPDYTSPSPTPAPTPTPTSTPVSTVSCPGTAPVAGWVCYNGNWLPPDYPGLPSVSPTPTPAPTPAPTPTSSTGCPGSAPGPGWVCSNGNWLPADFPGVTTSGSSCTSASPGTGWVCVNGGWLPPNYPGTPTNGCTGPDPFVGLPGILYGACIDGNWIPVMGAPAPESVLGEWLSMAQPPWAERYGFPPGARLATSPAAHA